MSQLGTGILVSSGANSYTRPTGGGLGEGNATSYQLGIYGLVQYTPAHLWQSPGRFRLRFHQRHPRRHRDRDRYTVGNPTSKILDARCETGVNLHWIKPYIAVEDQLVQSSAHAETGPSGGGSFALSYGSHTVNTPGVEIGFRNAGDRPVAKNWVLHLTDGFAFEHAANNSFEAAAYPSLPGSDFTTFGAQPGKNLARISLGAELKSRYDLTAGLTFDDAVSSRSQSYNGVFSLGYGW